MLDLDVEDDGKEMEATMPPMTTGPGMDMGMSQMYFHAGTSETILFEQWHVTSWQNMLISCLGVLVISMVYEAFKVVRHILLSKTQDRVSKPSEEIFPLPVYRAYGSCDSADVANVNSNNGNPPYRDVEMGRVYDGCCNPKLSMCSGWHWCQTFLYVVQLGLAYCLMLIFMTYNVYLCVAVLLGAGLGNLFFGWINSAKYASLTDICH